MDAVVQPAENPLTITAVTFPDTLNCMYVYVQGHKQAATMVESVELTGLAPPSHVWISDRRVEKGEKELAIITPSQRLRHGQHLIVKVVCKDGTSVAERIRVITGFPMATQFGAPPSDSGLDDGIYTWQPVYMRSQSLGGAPAQPPRPSLNGFLLLDCPTCVNGYRGDKARTAREILKRYEICAVHAPHHPGIVHACRIHAELGYAIFAETADILSFNPSVRRTASAPEDTETPAETVRRLCSFGARAAAPRPFFCMVDTAAIGFSASESKNFASPEEFRTRVFTLLGCGAKGMLYRHHGWKRPNELTKKLDPTIQSVNGEIRQIRELLAIADTASLATVSGEQGVTVYSLLAADEALLLFIVSHPIDEGAEKEVQIQFDLPSWVEPKRALQVTSGGYEDCHMSTIGQGILLPRPPAASVYVLPLSSGKKLGKFKE